MPTDSRQMAPEMPQVEPGHIPIVPRQTAAAVEPPPPPTDPGFVAMRVDMPRLNDDATPTVAPPAPAPSQLPRGLQMATGGLPPPLKDLKDYEPPDPSAPIKEAARKALNTRGKSGRPVWQELALAYVNRNQLRGRAARQAVQMFQTRAQGASPLEMRTVGAVEPKQSGNTPIENFLAARAQQSERLAPAVAGLMQRVGEEPSVPPSEIQRQIQADNPYESNTISGFLGEAEGNIERFVPAVLAPPTSTPLLALTGAEVAGQQYAEIDARRRAGQQISQSAADFNALANAAAEFVFERFGLGALQKHGTTLVRHTLKRVGIDLAKALGTNAAEEIATQAAQNAINRRTIAPETGYLDNVLRAGLQGAVGAGMIAGPVAAGRAALVLGSRQSQQGNQAQAQQQQQPSEPAAQQPTAAPPAAEPQTPPPPRQPPSAPPPSQQPPSAPPPQAPRPPSIPPTVQPPQAQPPQAQPPQVPPPQQTQGQDVRATQSSEPGLPPAPSEAARAYVEGVLRAAQRWGKGNPSQYASRRLREYAASLSLSRDFLQSKEDFDKTDNGKFATYLVDVARLIDAGKIAIPPATPPQTKTPEGTTEMPRGAEPATQEPVEAAPVTPEAVEPTTGQPVKPAGPVYSNSVEAAKQAVRQMRRNIQFRPPKTQEQAQFASLLRELGKETVIVSGAPSSFVLRNFPNVLFISENATGEMLNEHIVHELFHTVQDQHPDLAAETEALWSDNAHIEAAARYTERAEARGMYDVVDAMRDPAKQRRESGALLLGEVARKPSVIRGLTGDQRSWLKKVVDRILELLGVKKKLTPLEMQVKRQLERIAARLRSTKTTPVVNVQGQQTAPRMAVLPDESQASRAPPTAPETGQTKTPEGTTEMPRGAEPAPTGGLTNQQQPTAPAVRGQEVSSEVSQPPDDMRPVEGRPISFEQWLASKGIDRRSVLSEQEEADFIGATVFPRIMTGHQSGKYKSLAARYERTRQLLEQYAREVPNVVMGYVPLTDSPADQAYRRVLQKRRERQRLAAKQETTNATGVSGDAGQVSQAGDEPQGGQVQGRENLQQPPPGQPGGTGLRQEAQEQRAVSQLPGDEVASTPPQPQSVLDLRLPEPSGKSVEDIKRDESQRFSRTEQKPATGGRRAAVEQAIRPLRREFPSQRIQVVDSVDQLPESVRQDVASRGAEADVEALLAPDGSVFLIADNIADPQRAVLAAFHEIVGHAGIDATLKPAYKQRILEYVRRHEPELLEQVKRLYPQSEHTDEVLARLAERYAERTAERPPWYRRILDILRYAWRRLTGQGFDDRDIEQIMRRARRAAASATSAQSRLSRRGDAVKTRIRRITGLERPTGRVISEMTALEMKLRAEAKGSREGWRAAIDQNNALSKEYRRIVTESLPAGEREAALKALVGLNSLARLAGATRRLRKLVIEYELSDAMERLKKLTGKQILTVPRPPTEPKDLSEAEQAERAGRQKVAQIKRMATREIDLTKIDPDWRDRFKPLLEQAKVVALAARNAKTLDEKIAVTEAAGVLFGKLYELNMMHAMEKVEKVGRQKQTIAQLRERFVGLINQAGHLGQPDPQQQQPARDVGFFRRWVGRISATPQTLVQWIERRWDSDGEFAELILHQSREAANAREHQVLDFETRRAQALAEAGYPQWSRKFYDFMAKPQEVQLPDAGTLRLTRSQMVGIYGFINDPDTRDLVVRRGGLMFNFRSDPHAPAFKLTEADMDAVGDMLSEKEKAIIEFFRDYNERYLRDQSAKANYELKGYAPEMHEDYYKRSANMEKVETAGQPPIMRQLMRALENIPEMQERVGGTYYFVPDVIPDTDAVVFDSASLIHLAKQVRTVRMLLEHPRTHEALRQAFGPSMIREFESFLANLTESPDPQTWDRGTADKLAAMFYRAKLNLNPRTFVNNIVGGTIMLLPMFNMRHLAAGWKHRFDPQVHERMTKASAIAARRWRDPLHRAYGAFGRRHLSEARLSLGEAMAMFKQKLGEKDLRGAWESINQAMDSLSIMHIADSTPFRVAWAAAEAEVQERHPDWSQQQKDQYVLRRFHDAVMRTQNGMTPTETSRLWSAARTSVMLKGLTMLRNQQNKVLNLILQAANADGPTRAKLALAIGANLLSTGLTRTLFTGTAIGLLVAALRDDDPDEKEIARMLVNGGRRMLTEAFGIVPGGDIAADGLIGAITRGDTSIFDHPMAQPFEQVARGIGDAASGRLASAVMRMIAATRTLIGDPTQPITTDLYRLWKYGSGVDTRERARRVAGEARRQLVENRNTGGMGEYRKRQLGEIERQGRTISRLERESREADNPARRQYLQDRADELARQLKARRQEVTAN